MSLIVRPARAEDLQPAQDLVIRSINELTTRHGFGAMASVRPASFQSFSLRDDPAGLWVALDGEAIVGFAFSWVCDAFWFLAELFVEPGQQGRGIGDALLTRALDHAKAAGATNRALITFAFNTVSQGLYIRRGMYPRLPLYICTGARETAATYRGGETLQHSPVEAYPLHLNMLASIDASALGMSRQKHHRYLLANPELRGHFLHRGDDCVGYVYVSNSGQIGPLALTQPDLMEAAFNTALQFAVAQPSQQVSAVLPGSNAAALDVATRHGLRIAYPMVLVSAQPFGDWTRYLPRNPGFM